MPPLSLTPRERRILLGQFPAPSKPKPPRPRSIRSPRLERPCASSNAHPAVRPDDGRRGRDGRGPARVAWNKAGLPRGVYQIASGRFEAKFRLRGEMIWCGVFDTAEQAAGAVETRRKEMDSTH